MTHRHVAALVIGVLVASGSTGCGGLALAKEDTLKKVDEKLQLLSDPEGEKAQALEALFADVVALADSTAALTGRLDALVAEVPPDSAARLTAQSEVLLVNIGELLSTLRAELTAFGSTRVAIDELLNESHALVSGTRTALVGDPQQPGSGLFAQFEQLLVALGGAAGAGSSGSAGLLPQLTQTLARTDSLLAALEDDWTREGASLPARLHGVLAGTESALEHLDASARKASAWLDDGELAAKADDKRKWKSSLAGFQKLFGDYDRAGPIALGGALGLGLLVAAAALMSLVRSLRSLRRA